jgi:serine/threonine-protein kinase
MPDEREKHAATQTTPEAGVSSLLRGLNEPRSETSELDAASRNIPAPGDVLAEKYIVEHVIGAGGMGVVLAARHARLGQRVAIKFMQGNAARDKNAVARFLREAQAAAALSNEHVAKVYDFGTLESGEPYLVMEYLSGVDLKQVLRRDGPMAVADAVGAVLQACEAMTEAHARGIVHRDLKPANLFVTQRIDGTPLVKVLDFGISKVSDINAAGRDQSLTPSGLVMGSPQYMSPEQVRDAKNVDARSDVWALGVILYELLTGESPFGGQTLGATYAKILSESPAPLAGKRPDVPPALATTVLQCLQRDVTRRVQSVGELAEKLLPFASGEATLSAERILRVHRASGAPAAPIPTATLPSAAPPKRLAEKPAAAAPSLPEGETARPWLTSGAQRPARRPPVGALRVVAGLGGLVLAGTVAVVALRMRSHEAKPPAASTSLSLPSTDPVRAEPAASKPQELASALPSVPTPASPTVQNSSHGATDGGSVESAPVPTRRPSSPSKKFAPTPPVVTAPVDPFWSVNAR